MYIQTHIHICTNVDKYHFHMNTYSISHVFKATESIEIVRCVCPEIG